VTIICVHECVDCGDSTDLVALCLYCNITRLVSGDIQC
jgi:hypothetical protein